MTVQSMEPQLSRTQAERTSLAKHDSSQLISKSMDTQCNAEDVSGCRQVLATDKTTLISAEAELKENLKRVKKEDKDLGKRKIASTIGLRDRT